MKYPLLKKHFECFADYATAIKALSSDLLTKAHPFITMGIDKINFQQKVGCDYANTRSQICDSDACIRYAGAVTSVGKYKRGRYKHTTLLNPIT